MKRFLWGAGPRLWPLAEMLDKGNTLRHVGRNVPGDRHKHIHCKSHLGIPAAIHLSSVAEPAEEWLKAYSVVESSTKNIISSQFMLAGMHRNLTASLVFHSSVRPWCMHGASSKGSSHAMEFVPSLHLDLQLLANSSIPWIVRKFPDRYPFLLPGAVANTSSLDVFLSTIEESWKEQCAARIR
jgi:hypothetical protein